MSDLPQPTTKDDGKLHAANQGWAIVPAALMHDKTITDGAVRLYAHMHWRYGSKHDNHEGAQSMADELGVSEKTIRNRIRELEARDWIVTIDRGIDAKTGNYQTPFYHVFELQADCVKFRAEYVQVGNERISPKPSMEDIDKRKVRKGVGGNPKLKNADQRNSSSGGLRNSSSGDGRNSSSDNLPVFSFVPKPLPIEEPVKQDEPIRKQYPIFYTVGMKYKDGKAIDPLQFIMDVNAIFYAYLDALKAVGREKAAMYDYLWQEHREDCKNLALARVTPDDVTEYIKSRYDATVKTNAFWINQDEGMPLKNVVKGIASFIARKSRTVQTTVNLSDADRLREERNKARAAELAMARGEGAA